MSNTFDRLGYGTYKLADGEECVGGVAHAIETGYRHIDTAQGYDNEASVSVGIDRTDVGREDLFVATKLSTTGNLSYDDATATARVSRDRLGVDSIDLLYVHWPIDQHLRSGGDAARARRPRRRRRRRPDRALELPARPARRRAIDRLDHDVFAHQVECHPLLQQEKLRERAAEHDHWLVAYSPIARNRVADVDVLQEIAAAPRREPGAGEPRVAALEGSRRPDPEGGRLRSRRGQLGCPRDRPDRR